jgi:hypothetical protein
VIHVLGSGNVRLAIPLASRQIIHRTIYALYTPDLSSRSARRIGRLLRVSWMHSYCGCKFLFPIGSWIARGPHKNGSVETFKKRHVLAEQHHTLAWHTPSKHFSRCRQ